MAQPAARQSATFTKMWLLAAALMAFTASAALSQAPPHLPKSDPDSASAPFPNFSFDVASIRQNQADEHARSHIYNSDSDGRFTTVNLPLKPLLQFAFGLPESQIVGVPSAIGAEKFDIEARSDPAVDEQISKLNREQSKLEKRHMIQALLSDRFKLASHGNPTAARLPPCHCAGWFQTSGIKIRWEDLQYPPRQTRRSGYNHRESCGAACATGGSPGRG